MERLGRSLKERLTRPFWFYGRRVKPILVEATGEPGAWDEGWALSPYSLPPLDYEKYPSNEKRDYRTFMGKMIYWCKYQENISFVKPLSAILARFVLSLLQNGLVFHVIIPIPPSNLNRKFQPVTEITSMTGKMVKLPVAFDYLTKTNYGPCIKKMDPSERFEFIKNTMKVKDRRFKGKRVLLIDDMITTGATLREATRALREDGEVSAVYMATLTWTRQQYKSKSRTKNETNHLLKSAC